MSLRILKYLIIKQDLCVSFIKNPSPLTPTFCCCQNKKKSRRWNLYFRVPRRQHRMQRCATFNDDERRNNEDAKIFNLNYYNQLIFIFESERDNSTASNCFMMENAFTWKRGWRKACSILLTSSSWALFSEAWIIISKSFFQAFCYF